MVATSATRDASNRDVFFDMTAEVLGAVVPGAVAEVITGTEEAELSFRGAINELDTAAGPFVVVDLGGGSTEVVLGVRDMEASFSADIGRCGSRNDACTPTRPRRARSPRPVTSSVTGWRRRSMQCPSNAPIPGWVWRAR